MARKIPRWPFLWALLILAGCDGGGSGENVITPGTKPPSGPKVTATPPPGSYRAFELPVTISAPGKTLFYDTERTPDTASNLAFQDQFTVRLTQNTRINVIVQDGSRLWGPYVFEFQISKPVPDTGGCAVASLPKYWYTGVEPLSVSVDYLLPVSISQLDLLVDKNATQLTIDDASAQGTKVVTLGLLPHGIHEISCRLRSKELPQIDGNTIELAVDGQNPVAGWSDAGGTFSHDTWPGIFRIQATDTASGIKSVQVCDAERLHCMPMAHLSDDTYAYATVPTWETNTAASLSAIVSDVAGNSTVVGTLSLDLTGFAEPHVPAPPPITLTTDPNLDIPEFLGRPVSVVCDIEMSDCTANPTSVALAIGWNDFLFRSPGNTDWESLAIYRAGVHVSLPPSLSAWLVYASQSTAPMMQASLISVSVDELDWQRAWFEIPHLFFVEDVNGNLRWDQYDNFFTVATDTFANPYLSSQVPVEITPQQWIFPPQPAPMEIDVACPQDCSPGGRLYFERRWAVYGYPVTHMELGVDFASPVSVPATIQEWCTFYWDEDGNGAANNNEPRDFGVCSQDVFVLERHDGVFRWASAVIGLPYGGTVTRSLELLSSSGQILAKEPESSMVDTDGYGVITAALGLSDGNGRLPGVRTRMVFESAGAVTSVSFPFISPIDLPTVYQVFVSDETGAPLEALIYLRQDSNSNVAVSDMFGNANISTYVTQPTPSVMATRIGYLSSWVTAPTQSLSLRLLSPLVTGTVSGIVVDALGHPVTSASVAWRSQRYESATVSGPGGTYSLPASGGTGVLTVSAFGHFTRTNTYELNVTRESVSQNLLLDVDRSDFWPMGAWSLELPAAYGVKVSFNDRYYAAEVSTNSPLDVTVNGIPRNVILPGALPAPDYHGYVDAGVAFPYSAGLNLRAVCGARHQWIHTFVILDSDCWSLIGNDALQEYFFARLTSDQDQYDILGMAELSADVIAGNGLPTDQILTFHDMLLGRSIRIPIYMGLVHGYLPFGIYRVETEEGQWVEEEITVSSPYLPPMILLLPP